ncbi:tetratricopeptide repeat protein [Hymenobacter sp. IS2118]|uniref:tetratricopeptide repeat protein n=1 Tax=Hymenobacter sp. IS2118 TaxID=1505605 RepID=UPI0012697F0C|nr:tetratricopeptide repeat protein [Hymenobacter sp. IS2118]
MEWLGLRVLPARARVRWLSLLLLGLMLGLPAAAQLRTRTRKAAPARPAVVAPLPENPPAVQKKLDLAADLVNQFKDSEALAIYQDVLKTNPLHYLALWQAAVLSVKIGARYSDETRKAAYFDAGRQYGERALLLRPEGGESNLAVALALFNQATLYKAGARLKAFKDLRSHVYLATQNRPDMPQAWQLLGRWQYRVAHYSVLERLYSNLVLGGMPAGGSSREAIEALEKAHRMAPQNLQFCYDLARMYKYQGRRRRAIEILRHAEKIPPVTSEDLVLSRLCRKMLPPLLRADARRQKRLASARRPATPNAGAPADTTGNNDGSD